MSNWFFSISRFVRIFISASVPSTDTRGHFALLWKKLLENILPSYLPYFLAYKRVHFRAQNEKRVRSRNRWPGQAPAGIPRSCMSSLGMGTIIPHSFAPSSPTHCTSAPCDMRRWRLLSLPCRTRVLPLLRIWIHPSVRDIEVLRQIHLSKVTDPACGVLGRQCDLFPDDSMPCVSWLLAIRERVGLRSLSSAVRCLSFLRSAINRMWVGVSKNSRDC